jgi:hypothetical protein
MTIMLMVTHYAISSVLAVSKNSNYWRIIMKHKIHLLYLFMILGLNLLLTACLTMPLVVEGEMPTPMVTLVAAEPSPELSATPDPTETAEPSSSTNRPSTVPYADHNTPASAHHYRNQSGDVILT